MVFCQGRLDGFLVGVQVARPIPGLQQIKNRLLLLSGLAVVAGQLQGLLAERVKVVLNGGELVVSWAGIGQPVLMTGPATTVYQGRMEL